MLEEVALGTLHGKAQIAGCLAISMLCRGCWPCSCGMQAEALAHATIATKLACQLPCPAVLGCSVLFLCRRTPFTFFAGP